jgi:hypothetical protein
MPDDPLVILEVEILDNTDRLTAACVHRLYVEMIDRTTDRGRELLRVNAAASVRNAYPRDTAGQMVEHVDSNPVVDAGVEVSSSLGIRPVEEARFRYEDIFGADPADYPLFKDQGTREDIFSPRDRTMRFEGHSGETVFRKHVPGQEGAHFLAETYDEMIAVVLPAEAREFARDIGLLAFSDE